MKFDKVTDVLVAVAVVITIGVVIITKLVISGQLF